MLSPSQFQSMDLVFHVPKNTTEFWIFQIFLFRRRNPFFFFPNASCHFVIQHTGAWQLIQGWLDCNHALTRTHRCGIDGGKTSGWGTGVVLRLPRWNILTLQSSLERTKTEWKELNWGCETRGWLEGKREQMLLHSHTHVQHDCACLIAATQHTRSALHPPHLPL